MWSNKIEIVSYLGLKIGDLEEISKTGIFKITVYQGYKEEYTTFCTPECTKVINSYLEYRKRCGEESKSNAPLIREQFDASDSFRVKHPKHISLKTISKRIQNMHSTSNDCSIARSFGIQTSL